MIKHKEKNIYSLNAESYGITKVKWKEIKELVKDFEIPSVEASKRWLFNQKVVDGKVMIDEDLGKLRVWFLYDKLLQEKYNHLYKRDKLINPQVGDYCYCDADGFGRGAVVALHSDNLMTVKFDNRSLSTMCSSDKMVTVFDDVKRKITKL